MPARIGYPVNVTAADADLLRESRERLQSGKTFRQQTRQETWRQSERQYEGKHWESTNVEDPTADLITVNVSFSTVNTIMPYVTGQEPSFLVQPYSANATVTNARVQQALLNRMWTASRTGAKRALKRAVGDYLIYGDGILKVGYDLKERATGTDTVVDVAEIYVDRVNPWDFWIDPTADGLSNARWVCERIITTKRELEQARFIDEEGEEQPVYRNIDNLPFGSIDITDQDLALTAAQTTADDYIILYEYYDIVGDFMLVFADEGELPLRKVKGVQPPYAQLGNYILPRSPYSMGEMEMIWSQQQELNKSRSQLITHRRRNTLKYLVKDGAMGETAKAALQSPIVGEMVPIKGDQPLDQIVTPVALQPLMPESYNSADQAIRDIYEITGVNEYLRGATPEIRRTATEASIIEGASNVKTAAKLAAVEEAVREVGEIMLAIARDVFPLTDVDEMSFYITGDEAQRVNRAQGADEMQALMSQGQPQEAYAVAEEVQLADSAVVTPNESIFEGEYEVLVETGSTELRNPIFREQKAREMAERVVGMAPQLAQMGIQLNVRRALEEWFEAAGIGDIEGMFAGGPQPPPAPPPGAGPMGPEQMMGAPNLQGAQAPALPVTPETSGALPPA